MFLREGKHRVCPGKLDPNVTFAIHGDDTLVGGTGSDVFILFQGSGSDTIVDFEDGIDSLGLALGLSFNDLAIAGNANTTFIREGDELLAVLENVDFNLIGVDDFTGV